VTDDNVIAIYTVEDTGPIPFLVMPFVGGRTLQEMIDRTGALPLEETLRIGWRIAKGLAAAHRRGLVHHDVKPANILLEIGVEGERVKLTDFGLARAGNDTSASLTRLHGNFVAGTPMYMSPEQARGEPIDCRSDLFSLGSVLYTMCTGQPPFRGPNTLAVLEQVCEESPRPIREIDPELPAWVGDLLTRLHAKCPGDRVASAQEVADLLALHLAELNATPSRTEFIPFPIKKKRDAFRTKSQKPNEFRSTNSRLRRRPLAAVAVVLFLLGGLGMGMAEATGLTDLRGTVVGLFSPGGALDAE